MIRNIGNIPFHGINPLLAALLLLPFLAQASAASWLYRQTSDEMRATTVSFASVESDNSVQLSWPGGLTALKLTLRTRNPTDLSVYLTTGDGYFVCLPGDTVPVKFDDGPVEDYRCGTPADGGTQQIFLLDAFDFFSKLKRSNKVVIEPTFFEDGGHQFTFTTVGLGWT